MELKKNDNLMEGKGEWDESEHPRDNDGKFTDKGNSHYSSNQKMNNNKHKKKVLTLPKQEYAEVCSAIRTKYADKIPKNGYILYKNDFYVYNYNKQNYKIVCLNKIKIEGNEEYIRYLEGKDK